MSFAIIPKGKKRKITTTATNDDGNTPNTPHTIIKSFDPTKYLKGSERVGIIGLPGTGKSCTVKSLVWHLQHMFATLVVFSGSETDNGFYESFVPKLFIHNKLTEKNLKMTVNRQRLAMCNSEKKMGAYIGGATHTLIIMDDVLDDHRITNNKTLSMLYKQGRHLNTSIFLVQQYCMDVKPYVRTTTSAVFLFYNGNLDVKKRIYENYGHGVFKDYASFDEIYTFITSAQKFMSMVILLNQGNCDITDCVFWYKATPDEIPFNFKAGHPYIWQFNDERLDTEKTRDMTLLSTIETEK